MAKPALFVPIVDDEKFNPAFRALRDEPAYLPAKRMMEEVYETFEDLDGNFVEQFQSTGFDSRLWELYLHAYFEDAGFELWPA